MDKVRNQKIAKQVERWDLFARLTPTLFLLTTMTLILFDLVKVEYAFYVGLTGFAVTAVTWWWWAIFTIRYLITTPTDSRLLHPHASDGLSRRAGGHGDGIRAEPW